MLNNKRQKTDKLSKGDVKSDIIKSCEAVILEAADEDCVRYGLAPGRKAGQSTRELVIYRNHPKTAYFFEATEQLLLDYMNTKLQACPDFVARHDRAHILRAVYKNIVETPTAKHKLPPMEYDQNLYAFTNGVLRVLGEGLMRSVRFYDFDNPDDYADLEQLSASPRVAAHFCDNKYLPGSAEASKFLEELAGRTAATADADSSPAVPSEVELKQRFTDFFADEGQPLKITESGAMEDFIATEDLLLEFNKWCSSSDDRRAMEIPQELWKGKTLRTRLNKVVPGLGRGVKYRICSSEYAPNCGKPRGFQGVSGLSKADRGQGVQRLGVAGGSGIAVQQPALQGPGLVGVQLSGVEHALQAATEREATLEAQLAAALSDLQAEQERTAQLEAEVVQGKLDMAAAQRQLEVLQATIDSVRQAVVADQEAVQQQHAADLTTALEEQARELAIMFRGPMPEQAGREAGCFDWVDAFMPDEDEWEAARRAITFQPDEEWEAASSAPV